MTINRKISLINFYDSNRSKSAIKYIILHYVGAVSTAKNNAEYFYDKFRGASAHYFVDENEIWQVVEDNDSAWAIGANKYYTDARNTNSISIEMCCYKNSNGKLDIKEEVVNKAIELTKYLMKKYDIDADHVIRHYDATRKMCPAPFVNDGSRWDDFKKALGEKSTSSSTTNSTSSSSSSNNSSSNSLAVDGKWGTATTKRAQQVFKTTVDGMVTDQYACYKAQNPGLISFEWLNNPSSYGSELIRAIQKKVGANVDGHIGPNTIKKMQAWLGTVQDGCVSNPSDVVKALQKWLNKQ